LGASPVNLTSAGAALEQIPDKVILILTSPPPSLWCEGTVGRDCVRARVPEDAQCRGAMAPRRTKRVGCVEGWGEAPSITSIVAIGFDPRLKARYRPRNAHWSPIRRITPAGTDPHLYAIALGNGGEASVITDALRLRTQGV
jgi:hypothetical protein